MFVHVPYNYYSSQMRQHKLKLQTGQIAYLMSSHNTICIFGQKLGSGYSTKSGLLGKMFKNRIFAKVHFTRAI